MSNEYEEIFWKQIDRVCEARSEPSDCLFEYSMESLIMILPEEARQQLNEQIEKARNTYGKKEYQELFQSIMDLRNRGLIY